MSPGLPCDMPGSGVPTQSLTCSTSATEYPCVTSHLRVHNPNDRPRFGLLSVDFMRDGGAYARFA